MDDELVTIQDAAQALAMTPGAVRKAIHQGRITPRRFGARTVLVPRVEVERYKRERKPAGRPLTSSPESTPRD